jgi:HSP20 family protein
MRRQTALKTDPRQEAGRTPLKSVKSGNIEVVPTTNLERSIFSTLRDMERVMEDALLRPFSGLNTFPIRQAFQGLGGIGEFAPAVDIFEEKGEVVIKSDLPGLNRDDINVKIVGNSIIITGEKKTEEKVERKDYLRVERSHGSFNRTLSLPEGVDTDHIKASFKDGVLEVRLPKSGKTGLGRQISIK